MTEEPNKQPPPPKKINLKKLNGYSPIVKRLP
jgi:hypothetical protein